MLGGRLELRSSNESEAENDGDGHEPVGAIRGRARIVAREAGENKRKRVRSSDGTKHKRLQSMGTKFWTKGVCCKTSMALKDTCCAEDYDNVLVFQIRQYFMSLSDTNQRLFFKERMTARDANVHEEGEDMTGRLMHSGMRMEKPDVFGRLLGGLQQMRHRVLPRPKEQETQYVCIKFALSMVMRSVSWLYPHTKRDSNRYVPGGHRSAADRDFPTVPGPKQFNRDNPKTTSILHWMKEEAKLHLMLPNEPGTVLPYTSKYGAHAAYVVEQEFAANFDHREWSERIFEERQQIAEEAVEEEDLDHAFDEEVAGAEQGAGRLMDDALESVARGNRSKYRYGNPLLGLVSDVPEAVGVGGYRLLCNLWRHSPKQKNCHPEAPVLKLRKWMPFAKCDECLERRKAMELEKDHDAQNNLREAQRAHIRFVKMQRLSYKLRALEGTMSPLQYLSIIMDGADQSDYCLPYTCNKSHKSDQAWKLKLHLMGVIAHGHGAYVYTCPHNHAQGHNVTIQALFDTLVQLMEDNDWAKLPEVLYLQLDNTTKQNKGRYLLAFLALLVEAGTFRKIIVSFLPVGHTHEDIDQFFSRVAMALRRHDAHSRLMLADVIKRISVRRTEWGKVRSVVHWENVGNISGWLEDKVHAMDSITMWHQFKLTKCATSGQVLLVAREWPAAAGDKADYWSGMNKNNTHQPIWIPEEVPNLFEDYENVPNGKLPTTGMTLETAAKIKEGVEQLLEVLRASEACKADTLHLLDVSRTAASASTFAWDKRHIEMLLGGTHRGLARAAAADDINDPSEQEDQFRATKDCLILENAFYLMQPPRGESEPFWIAKVKKRTTHDGLPHAHVQYWEPLTEMKKPRSQRDFYKCKYGCAKSNPPNKQWAQLPRLDITEGFTLQISMNVGADGTGILTPGNRDAKLQEIRWYVETWKEDSHMVLEPDERIPEHLVPEGRIDIPAEKTRKPRKKTVAKPAAKDATAAKAVRVPKRKKD
jgi:hypothetical protein